MASNKLLHILITFALLFSSTTLSLDSTEDPETSTIPEQDTGADDSLSFPSPSPSIDYPYMSPPADLAPTLASSPSFGMSPAPEPEEARNTTASNVESEKPKDSSSKGLTSGKKAGISIGVIAAVCVVGFGGMLYKKRKQNIHRAQLGYIAREDFI
ncbi:unnamed protein product [Lactuca virosa]|uniref:Uncharacterized protein n=1 Tax=Lactuca virosa TaxID=75947 RepID=A0AAU9NJ96_9ASTR|nr:unnamed protein product [Lactuca virosa]